MCDCDCSGPDVYDCTAQKARKPHRCSECWRTIAKGESYERHSGLWDGSWETFRWCQHCSAACKVLTEEIEDFCFCFGSLYEAVSDKFCYGHFPNMAVGRVVAGAYRKWTHRRGHQAGQLMAVPVMMTRNPVEIL
jgi:hypothetical protein